MVRTALLSLMGVIMAAATGTAANPQVVIETSLGNITVELFEDKSPITVKNFLGYVDDKFYDGVIFHRVMDGFMIQTGGVAADGKEKKTKERIKNETQNKVRNEKYTLAMARTSELDSATSQFFINVAENRSLDFDGPFGGYAVFGKVIAGQDVVDKLAKVEVKANPGNPRERSAPVNPPVLKSAKRVVKK